jgi:hypothetical protein
MLKDLDRWAFGPLLAKRAQWVLEDAERIDAEVLLYRLGILLAVLKSLGAEFTALSEAVQEQRRLALSEQAPYSEAMFHWETALAGRFLERLEALAPFGEAEAPLTRFAHGQYFKYSRRVAYLLQTPAVLPCLYAPKVEALR